MIYQYPVANIEAIADACKQVLINFNSTIASKDSIAYRFWNFGNGVTSKDSTVKIMYYTDGNYEIKLIVGTVNRCYDSTYQQITIHPTPSFAISGSSSICRGDSVRLSVSGNNNYIWKDANNNFSSITLGFWIELSQEVYQYDAKIMTIQFITRDNLTLLIRSNSNTLAITNKTNFTFNLQNTIKGISP